MTAATGPHFQAFESEHFQPLEQMAHGATLTEVLESIVTLVERQASGMLCSILLFDASAQRLRHGAAPSLPTQYCRAIDGVAIGPEVGSCGTAAYLRQAVIVADIETHPYWREYKHLALPHGLKACWSSPILSPRGEVLGTFAMYFHEARNPSEAELRWVKAATHLAAVSIGHHRTLQMLESAELRARNLARLYAVSSSVGDAIVRVRDPDALYEHACRIAVEHRLARLAWVGLYDAEADRIVPVARWGEDGGYIDAIVLNLRSGSNNRGPAARALQSGACAVSNDIANDPDFFWRDEALARGLRACAVFPLNVNGRAIGVIAMYADRAGYFGSPEQKVLSGLADNIAFAVSSARAERERQELFGALTDRVKELTLLHAIARLLPGRRLDKSLLDEIVAAIPTGWQFPAACAARIRWNGLDVATANWRDTDRALSAPIVVGGSAGSIEVAYVEGSATFLEEERHVLRSVADMLSTHFSHQMAASERQRSEARLKAVIEHTPNVAIQWYDGAGRLLFCNRASESLFGWVAERAIGKTLGQLGFPPPDADRFANAIRQVAATGLPFGPVEFNYDRSDGTRGTLLSTIFRIPYGDDEHCYVCMDVDLTERNRMAERVRAAEKVRAAIYSGVADGIFYLTVEPEQQFRFVAVNPAFLAATGFTEADVVNRLASDVLPEASRRQTLAMFARAIAEERPVSWQEAPSYPAGLRHWEVTVAPILGADGGCTHIVGTVHDITQRRLAEEQRRGLEAELQKAQRLEALGTLAGGVAHDFNNILTAIAGNAALGLGRDGAEAQRCLGEIRRAADRASSLVRQLLTFGRAEAALQRRHVDLRAVVDEAVGLLRSTLPPGVALKASYAETMPEAHADASQVHQIVMNLTTNAVHALEGEGAVEISVDGCEIVDSALHLAPGRYARVTVSDDGCGMDATTVQKVFEPFFTTKSPGRGTGLGLSVVHGIVKAHGGAINVTSEPGRGTTFEVLLPAAAVRSSASPPAAHRGEILYVDDDHALAYLVTRILERAGYRVTACTDPADALRRFGERPEAFGAVVTDVSMVGMSGVELARELRKLRCSVPIVLTSGYLRDEVLDAAKALQAEVLLKPNTVDELGSTLHRLLSSPGPVAA